MDFFKYFNIVYEGLINFSKWILYYFNPALKFILLGLAALVIIQIINLSLVKFRVTKDSLKEQSFYNNLYNDSKQYVENLINANKNKNFFTLLSYVTYTIMLALILLCIPSFLGSFTSTTFIILAILLVLAKYLVPHLNDGDKNYTDSHRAYITHTKSVSFCKCDKGCTCSSDVTKYLEKKYSIKL